MRGLRLTPRGERVLVVLGAAGWLLILAVLLPSRRGRGGSEGRYDEGFAIDRISGYSCDETLSVPGAETLPAASVAVSVRRLVAFRGKVGDQNLPSRPTAAAGARDAGLCRSRNGGNRESDAAGIGAWYRRRVGALQHLSPHAAARRGTRGDARRLT